MIKFKTKTGYFHSVAFIDDCWWVIAESPKYRLISRQVGYKDKEEALVSLGQVVGYKCKRIKGE